MVLLFGDVWEFIFKGVEFVLKILLFKKIGLYCCFDFVCFSFDDVKVVKNVIGMIVNDVVFVMVLGGMCELFFELW